MLKSKILILFICFAALCLSTGPASADLFDYSVDELRTIFAPGTTGPGVFSAAKTGLSMGSVTGKAPPAAGTKAYFMWQFGDSGDFALVMTISNIVSTPGSESADDMQAETENP